MHEHRRRTRRREGRPGARGRSVVIGAAAALLVLIAGAGCKKPRPALPPPQARALPPLEVDADKSWLFTHVTPQGRFETVDDPEVIPRGARRQVRVIDPSRPAGERSEGTDVYVVDTDELTTKRKAHARVVSREAFESGALAQLPPGESSAWPRARAEGPSAPVPPTPGPTEQPVPADGQPVVIVYGTSWCGACRAAREYLTERKIPFVDKDVERDDAAARELAGKGARLGVPTDRVPVLDVRGRLLLGFDKARLEAMLGEAS